MVGALSPEAKAAITGFEPTLVGKFCLSLVYPNVGFDMTVRAERAKQRPAASPQWLSVLSIGSGLGWLVSQSASPVLALVITSLLGLAGGIVTGLRSVRGDAHGDAPSALEVTDARPAALLIVAIAFAATAGLVVKSHRLLEPAPIREAAWRAAAGATLVDLGKDPHAAMLFAVEQKECNALLSLRGNERAFVGELRHSSLPGAQKLIAQVDDYETLVKVVDALCARP